MRKIIKKKQLCQGVELLRAKLIKSEIGANSNVMRLKPDLRFSIFFIIMLVCVCLAFFIFSPEKIVVNATTIEYEITSPDTEYEKYFYTIEEGVVCNFRVDDVDDRPIVKIKFNPDDAIFNNKFGIYGENSEYANLDEINDAKGYFSLEEEDGSWIFSVIVYVNGELVIANDVEEVLVTVAINKIDTNPPNISDLTGIDIELTKDYRRKYIISLEDKLFRTSKAHVSGIKEVKIYSSTSPYKTDRSIYTLLTGATFVNDEYEKIELEKEEIKNFLNDSELQFYFPIDPIGLLLKHPLEYRVEFEPINNGYYYMEMADAAGNTNVYYLFPFFKNKDPRYNFSVPKTSPGATGQDIWNAKMLIDNFIALLKDNEEDINLNVLSKYVQLYQEAIYIFEGIESYSDAHNENKKEVYFLIEEEYANLKSLLSYPQIKYEIKSDFGSDKKVVYELNKNIFKSDVEINFKKSLIYFELTNLRNVLSTYKYGDQVEFKIDLKLKSLKNFLKEYPLSNEKDYNAVLFIDCSIYLNSKKVTVDIQQLNMTIIIDDSITNVALFPEKTIYRQRDKYAFYNISINIDEANYLIYYQSKSKSLTKEQIILMATLIPISAIIVGLLALFFIKNKYKKKKV